MAQPSAPAHVRLDEAASTLTERLPWDFRTTFPQPLPEAIDAGVVDEADAQGENLAAMHEAYAGQVLAALRQLDAVMDAARRRVDPGTGKRPGTHAGRERLRTYLSDEPAKLQRWFDTLVGTYGAAFGTEAADAFARAVRARHAGVAVVGNDRPWAAQGIVKPDDDARPIVGAAPAPKAKAPEPRDRARMERPRHRVVRTMPVPRPLPAAVAAGVFGREDGKPIRPSATEVREITEAYVDALVELIVDAALAERRSLPLEEVERGREAIRTAVALYADDFGEDAADRLLAFAEREARDKLPPEIGPDRAPSRRSSRPGHGR